MAEAETKAPATWPGWPIATAICIRFYSRLPVPRLAGEGDLHAAPDFRSVPRALPLAALVVAFPGALLLLAAGLAGLSAPLAATLAVTALVVTTGAFHEDGMADSADGLFGGHAPERRLEIMKDSRIGTYGACALGLSLLLRILALAGIHEAAGSWAAAAAVLVAAPWSRMQGMRLLAGEAPARSDGASASVGTPSRDTVLIGLCLAAALATALALAAKLPISGLVLGGALAWLGTSALARLARRLIGGQTGDILGAAQQVSEIAIYLGLALMLGRGAA